MPGVGPGPPAKTNYRLKKTLTGHEKGVSCVKYSVGEGAGKYLASASADKTAKIWDAQSGELLHTLVGHLKGVNDVAWEARGRYLATASDDATVRFWDVSSGKCLRILPGHTNYVFCCAFNPHGNLLASGSHDETIKVWEARTGTCIRSLPAHSDPVTSVQFSSDGTILLSSSFDGLVRLWDTETGKCLRTLVDESSSPVSLARFSPNCKYILTVSLEDKVKLWDYLEQRIVKTYTGHKNSSFCMFAAFGVAHPGGPSVVTGSEDHSVNIYSLNQESLVQTIAGRQSAEDAGDGHCDVVLAVDHHPTRAAIASGGLSKDCTIKLWEDS